MKDMRLNCEYITKILKLPFFLESAFCDRIFMDVPIISSSTKPLTVIIDHVDAFISLVPPPQLRDDKCLRYISKMIFYLYIP
jgi:hypothetical protein